MADDRTYIRLHDGMPDHPKVDTLSDKAFRLLIASWCYCSRHLTNGEIPAKTWGRRGTPKARKELEEAGLVRHENGVVIMHDYLKHQRSAEEVAELKAKRAQAGKRGADKRWGGVAKGKASAIASAMPNAEQVPWQTDGNADGKTMASTETETETEGTTADDKSSDEPTTAQTLVAEWIDHCQQKPPSRVIGQVARELKVLLDDGIAVPTVRQGLAAWSRKSLHPSTLASVVHEAQKNPPLPTVVDDESALPPVEQSWMARRSS